MSLRTALDFVLSWEGGFVDHPSDPGKATNFGISQHRYPREDIRRMTEPRARYLYERDYWDAVRGDELPDAVALAVMDYAVNSGVPRASRALQREVGARVDGVIGGKTLKAVAAKCERLGDHHVALGVLDRRLLFLTAILKKKPTQYLPFLTGWMRRLISLADALPTT